MPLKRRQANKTMNHSLAEKDYLKAWAAFVLCATLGGFVAGFVVSVILGFALRAANVAAGVSQVWCSIAGFVASLPVSYIFFKIFVSKFLIARITPAASNNTPPQNA
jgi:hypothetical protein